MLTLKQLLFDRHKEFLDPRRHRIQSFKLFIHQYWCVALNESALLIQSGEIRYRTVRHWSFACWVLARNYLTNEQAFSIFLGLSPCQVEVLFEDHWLVRPRVEFLAVALHKAYDVGHPVVWAREVLQIETAELNPLVFCRWVDVSVDGRGFFEAAAAAGLVVL